MRMLKKRNNNNILYETNKISSSVSTAGYIHCKTLMAPSQSQYKNMEKIIATKTYIVGCACTHCDRIRLTKN